MQKFRGIGLAVVIVCVVGVSVLYAQQKGDRESTDEQNKGKLLSNLSWIAGTWVANKDGNHLEEIWSEPVGDTMMGMFRWVKDGKVWMNEIMTITDESEGLVFRLRHFDRKMTAWEDKDDPFYYPVKHVGRNEIVFENPKRDQPRSMTYRRVDDTLYVILEGYKDGQKSGSMDFVFQRKTTE